MVNKRALLVNPPVYDTQYWERWSMPHGLLKVATYLKKEKGYQTKLIDCLAPDGNSGLRKKSRELVQVGTKKRWKPGRWGSRLAADVKTVYSFGKDIEELEKEFRGDLFSHAEDSAPPDEVWITSIMSYWWESTRDVISLSKKYFPQAKIRVGGIYPTLDPLHAAAKLGLDNPLIVSGKLFDPLDESVATRDVIVTGEIPAANDLELDHDLYEGGKYRPKYTILTTSRGCPRDCEYCAAYVLSGRRVTSRDPKSVLEEIKDKYERGVRDFCFYEDNLLMAKKSFKEILTLICENKRDLKGIELHSPEGLEIRLVEPDLAVLMREAGFRRVYLPLESINHDYISKFQRDFYTLKHFEQAVKIFEEAGFRNPQQINVFVLFGLPGEDLQHVYDTAVYAANRTGSVIPMLFAPVPGTPLFEKLRAYIEEKDFDLQDLNGKLLPFLEYNQRAMKGRYDLTIQDYYDIEAFMFRLNEKVRNKTFRPGNNTPVSKAFRKVFTSYDRVFEETEQRAYFPELPATLSVGDTITEFHGTGQSLQALQEGSAQLL